MPTPRRVLTRLTLVGLAAGLVCCDEQCTPSTEPSTESGYTLDLWPIGLELTNGGSGTSSIIVRRDAGFREAVTLRVIAPPGVDATPASNSIPYGTVAVDLAVSVPAGTEPGTYWVRIVGSARGLADRTDSLGVNVSEALGSFTLWVSPTTRVLLPGQRDTVMVSIARVPPFARIVDLSVTGVPPGVYAFCTPHEIVPGAVNSRLVLEVTAEADPGTWPLTVTGSSARVASQSAVLTLTVLPLPEGFVLLASPDTLVVPQRRRGTVTVTIERAGTFSGTVSLSAAGAPYGVTPGFDPASMVPPATTASLNLDVAFHVPTGDYPLTVRGSGAGVASRADTLVLRVTPARDGFTLAVSPDTISVPLGQIGTATVAVTRFDAFSGDVALIITDAPAGVSASFAPATVPGSSTTSTLSISVDSTVAPGTYPMTVRGTGAGYADANAPLVLTVPSLGGIPLTTPSMWLVGQGGMGSAPLAIGRIAPFTGAVTLGAEGLPAGVTAVFTPATLEAGQTSATVAYTALATVPVGTYEVTIRASGTGVPSATAKQSLLVTAQ